AQTASDGAQTVSVSTISMRFDKEKGPRFTGSTKVKAGQPLRVRNLTDPQKIGPHTFTLVSADRLPRSRKAQRECFTPGKLCMDIALAHEFDEKTETINRPLVEAGLSGWDRRFSRKVKKGDSWFSETKGEEFQQAVKAKPGTVLRYVCAVHPEMHGMIKVVH
ncbi:MAG TPA: hypothetical protein VGW11_01095, partial [Solirubrobacteraceae bacterium]|nr:hypothetical protein [Solirubrobacteraceae bacterium]